MKKSPIVQVEFTNRNFAWISDVLLPQTAIFLLDKLLLLALSILVWWPSSFRSSENLLRTFHGRSIYQYLLTLNGQILTDWRK